MRTQLLRSKHEKALAVISMIEQAQRVIEYHKKDLQMPYTSDIKDWYKSKIATKVAAIKRLENYYNKLCYGNNWVLQSKINEQEKEMD